jgi:hypothetical protein
MIPRGEAGHQRRFGRWRRWTWLSWNARRLDSVKFHEIAAADFYAFDGGERYKGDELIDPAQEAARRREGVRLDDH